MTKHGLIFILAAALMACSSAEDRKAAYLEKAADMHAQGNYEKARLELKNALQIDPKDAEAWYLMGEMEEKLQNWRAAAGNYQRVLEMDAAHSGAKLKLGRLYLVGGVEERAEPLLEDVLKTEPDNVDALVLRGGLAARRGDLEGASRDARLALEKAPGHIDATILNASLAIRGGNAEAAIGLLTKAAERNPEHTGLRAVLAEVYSQQGRIDEGAAQLKEIIALEPRIVSHRMRLAQYYSAKQRLDEAEQVLREGLRQQADSKELKLALVNFLGSQRKPEQAVEALQQFIKETPEEYELRFRLAEIHRALGQGDEARGIYEAIIAAAGDKPDGLKARTQLARQWIEQGQAERGAVLLAEVLKENPSDNDALFLRAGQALTQGDAAAAIADLRAVLRDQPASVPVLQTLARAHLFKGEADLALEAMQKAVEAAPHDAATRVALAGLLAEQGKKAQAREHLELVLKADPKSMAALETLFKLHAAEQDYVKAAQLAQRIQALQPGRGEYYAGLVLQAQNKPEEAIARFEAALKAVPGAVEPLAALIKIRLAKNQAALAEQRLRQELARDDDNVVAHNLLGEVLLLQKKTAAAIVSLREAERLNPRLATPYRNLAAAHLVQGEAQEAMAILRKGIAATGHDPGLVFALASYEENQGRADQAIVLYEKALDTRPGEAMFVNNLAMLLANYRKDKADLNRAMELSERLKGHANPAYLDTLGWVYYRRGDVEAAVPVLESAAREAPDSPLLSYHLGMAYYQKGDHQAARRHLEKAVTDKANYHGIDEAKTTLAKLAAS